MNYKPIDIRLMQKGEEKEWARLRLALWPHHTHADNDVDVGDFIAGRSTVRAVFLAFVDDSAEGFAEISERSYVDGCGNAPAAHLEGWYVGPDWRRSGMGRGLIAAATEWAQSEGYDWLGSDVELENNVSQSAHQAIGFEEVGRVVNYRKRLKQ